MNKTKEMIAGGVLGLASLVGLGGCMMDGGYGYNGYSFDVNLPEFVVCREWIDDQYPQSYVNSGELRGMGLTGFKPGETVNAVFLNKRGMNVRAKMEVYGPSGNLECSGAEGEVPAGGWYRQPFTLGGKLGLHGFYLKVNDHIISKKEILVVD